MDLLSAGDARELLARRLGAERISAEPAAVDEIVERCARLPLALAIAAARAASCPAFPLAHIADQLRAAGGGLHALAGGDPATDLRAVFSWSYRALSGGAAALLRQLGLHPGPDVGEPAVASVAGLPTQRARSALAELVRANIVTEHAPGRYVLHDLLRAYAAEQAHLEDGEDDRRATRGRIVDHYRCTALRAAELLDPHRTRPREPDPPGPCVTPERPGDAADALRWFAAEQPVAKAAVGLGPDRHAVDLAAGLWTFFDRHGHWHDLAASQQLALAAAVRTGDRWSEAEAHRGLARALTRLGAYDDAAGHLDRALHGYGELGDRGGQAQTHIGLGILVERQGLHREALAHTTEALRLYRGTGDRAGLTVALNAVGWDHAQLGDHDQALLHCEEALALHRELGDRHGAAKTWDSLGYVHRHLGDHARATACYRRAVDLFRQLGDRYYESDSLTGLGETRCAAGDHRGSRRAWQQALAILVDLHHPDAEPLRARLRRHRC